MGLLHIYDTVSNEHKSIRANGRLKDILPDYDFTHCAVIKAGERMTADYTVSDDDILYIRKVPAMTGLAIAAVAVAVVAVGVGIGAYCYANKKIAEAEEEAKKAQENAKKLAQQVTQYPFIKGASNTSALGQTIQYVFGSIYNTPYKLNDGFYSIGGTDGEKQYYNIILSAGFGKQLIESLSIGSEKIKDFTETSPQSGVYSFNSDSLYYDSENIIEIAQEAEFTKSFFQQKVKSEYSGEEVKHEYGQEAEPLILQCAENTMRVEVCLQFNGLRQFKGNNWTQKSVTVNPYWSNDGGSSWHAFTFDRGSNTFEFNSNHTLRFTATRAFSYAECYGKQISIKLERTTPKNESNSQESAYCLYMNSFCYDNAKSAGGTLTPCKPLESPFMEKTTRIGVRIIANQNTSNMLDKINAMCYGVARTWNKVLRTWSDTKTPTRNIASWILEILESDTHKPSQYTDGGIDLLSFGDLYEYCESKDNQFYCDGIITKGEKKETVISKLLSLCNADMYIDSDGKLAIAIDRKESTPVALLNAQSVKSVKVAKSFERQPDGIKANFTNRDTWQTDTRYCMRDGGAKGIDDTCTETTIEYATEAEHVYKICQRRMRQQVLQPREVTVQVGREGDYYPLYATVMLQLEQLRQGLRSAIIHRVRRNADGKVTSLDISDMVDFGGDFSESVYIDEDGKRYTDEDGGEYGTIDTPDTATYGVMIQAQDGTGKRHIGAQVYGFGKTRTIYFFVAVDDSDGVRIQAGNELSFGLLNEQGGFDRITNIMKITATKPSADGWELTLKDYSEAIYEYGKIPEYRTNLTSPNAAALPASTTIRESEEKAEREEKEAETTAAIGKAIEAGTTSLELSRTSIQFHMNGADNTLYAETMQFTAALMQGGEGLEADTVTASVDSQAFSVTASKSGAVITVSVTSRYGAAFTSANVTVTATYGGLTFSNSCTVTASDTARYLNAVSSLSGIPANPALGDYFTWTGDNTASALVYGGTFRKTYVYRYVGNAGGEYRWSEDTRIEHNADALSDILAMNTESAAATNSYALTFLNRLVANTIFVNNLLVKFADIQRLQSGEITVKTATNATNATDGTISGMTTGGASDTAIAIHSSDWTGKDSTSGFGILKNGDAYFNNGSFRGTLESESGYFKGDVIFAGSIASGPLYLDEQNPTNIESQFVANAGDSTQAFFDQIKNSSVATLLNGTFDFRERTDTTSTTYAFSHIQIVFETNGYGVRVYFLDSKLNRIKHHWIFQGREVTTEISQYIGMNTKGTYNITQYSTMSGALVLNKYSPTGKTLKLIDLPTSAASQSGYVYRDSEGYLRIS